MSETRPVIAVIGGTGALGAGLVLRLAQAGYRVIIGSRSQESAETAAQNWGRKTGTDDIQGMDNQAAASAAEIVILTVPYAHHRPTLAAIKPGLDGKILIDVTVPLQPPKVRTVHIPEAGSAAKAAQLFLGDDVRVVSAFQNVAADHLADLDHNVDCDVLVCGNDPVARQQVITLIEAIGLKGWHAGRIDNSIVAEALTSALIFINNHHKIDGAGIRITGNLKTAPKASG